MQMMTLFVIEQPEVVIEQPEAELDPNPSSEGMDHEKVR
jgi:hypothetical protein